MPRLIASLTRASWRLAAVFTVLGAAVCVASAVNAQQDARKLVGLWVADIEKTQALLQGLGVGADEIEATLAEVRQVEIRFELQNRFEFRVLGEDVPLVGQYAVTPADGRLRVALRPDAIDEFDPIAIEVDFADADHIVVHPPADQRPAVFRRVNVPDQQDELVRQLIGSWRGHPQRTREALERSEVDEDFIDDLVDRVSRLAVHFKPDGSYELLVREDAERVERLSGHWQVVSRIPRQRGLVIETRADSQFGGERLRFDARLLEGDFLQLTQDDGQARIPAVLQKRPRE